MATEIPFGVQVLQKSSNLCCPGPSSRRLFLYRCSILLLTFMSYTCYHLSRKSISVVKNVLNQNCSNMVAPSGTDTDNKQWCDWAPFDGDDASLLLGTLDSSFLFAYAGAMFVSGFVAERVSLRYFLSLGMISSGIFCYFFGIAHSYKIHSFWYFVVMQALGGICQTTGWPGVVTVVGNWFGKAKRGLIFGIWNSHTSVGNILGSLIAGAYVDRDWGLSFIVPGVIVAVGGFIIFLFLVEKPSDVGCPSPQTFNHGIVNRSEYQQVHSLSASDSNSDELDSDTEQEYGEGHVSQPLYEDMPIMHVSYKTEKAIGFMGALKIPGVIEFSMSLFFAKLVSYTFLYWLPHYIQHSTTLDPATSADLSTLFDVGGIVGGIAAGMLSDITGMNATVCGFMLGFAAPMLFIYEEYGTQSITTNIILLIVSGFLVNGPYALITTAVSAELGTHHSLQGNSKALATVTAIIDGTGSIGAAVGPILAGLISNTGWRNVFYMLIASNMMALVFLFRLIYREVSFCRRR